MNDNQWLFTDSKGNTHRIDFTPSTKATNRPIMAIDRNDGTPARALKHLRYETMKQTADCIHALHRTTTETELLKIATGNKWIVRRAIELYKRNLVMEEYGPFYMDIGWTQGSYLSAWCTS